MTLTLGYKLPEHRLPALVLRVGVHRWGGECSKFRPQFANLDVRARQRPVNLCLLTQPQDATGASGASGMSVAPGGTPPLIVTETGRPGWGFEFVLHLTKFQR